MKLEHKAGPDAVRELALRLYPTSLESFREAISNSFDEGSRKVEIQVSLNEVVMEDYGEGIDDVERFRSYGQYSKAKVGGETIGMKGMGKLSLLRLGENVEFRTNNGEFGMDIMMTPDEFEVNHGGKDKYLQHRGTQIIILKPQDVPPIDEVARYLDKVFGLRIAMGAELILNGVSLSSKIDATEHFLFRLKGGVDVTGNLKQSKTGRGTVDVYCKHVFVRSLLIDPGRLFSGWVNCNELVPTTSRNEIVEDNAYKDFIDHLREYVAKKFPKKEENLTKDELLAGKELDNMLKNYLKDMKLLPEGKLPMGKGTEPELNKQEGKRKEKQKEEKEDEEKEPEYVKEHTSPKTNKPIKRTTKTNYGVLWIDQDAGNDKDPLFFVAPNMCVRNRNNDLYQFSLRSKPALGPRWLRLTPYLARLAISINPHSKKWNHDELYHEMDQAIRYFLKKREEL